MASPLSQFPTNVVQHCVERLQERYEVTSVIKAKELYLTHHGQLVRGEGELLFSKKPARYDNGSLIFRLEHGGRHFYPARCLLGDRWVTVTYLSPSMVLNNLVELYVLENAEDRHGLSKRPTA